MVNFTSQIQSSLDRTRMKYEKDLEDLHRSYRSSLNDLHTLASNTPPAIDLPSPSACLPFLAEQIEEIHKSIELQYWKRLSDMRRRFESKLSYS